MEIGYIVYCLVMKCKVVGAARFVSERLLKSTRAGVKTYVSLSRPLACKSNETNWYKAKCNRSETMRTWWT